MKILAADTALGACSAALLQDGQVLAHRFTAMERGHAEALAPMVEEVMRGHAFSTLDRLAVTTGPGTFTGQRVGLAFMRALKVALHVPLSGVTTLAAMAAQAEDETGLARGVALHDAKRDEVYVEIDGVPRVLRFESAIEILRSCAGERFALAGTAAIRACEALADNAVLSQVRQPDALWVARLAASMPPDDGVPRPLYLRAPDAKLPGGREPVRPATAQDMGRLAELHAQCFAKPWDEKALKDLVESPGVLGLSDAHGFVIVRVAAGEAEILTLAVSPEARRKGSGAALMQEAARQAQEHGASAMFLEVGCANAAAKALYERLGFRNVGTRKSYYEAGEDALILRRDLPLAPMGNGSVKVARQ
jgi:tRNA threonylcarbamoyladenosine biosynthesis protein TsaB